MSLGVANPLLIQLMPGVDAAALSAQEVDVSLQTTDIPGLMRATGDAGALGRLSAALSGREGVSYVEPEHTVHIERSPDDPFFANNSLWGLNGRYGINATAAWDVTTGSTLVTVADIDTGIDYNHPDLYKNIWINQAEIPASRRANLAEIDGDGRITFYDLNHPVNQGAGKITDINVDGRIDAGDILAPMAKDSGGGDTGFGGWSDGVSQDGDAAYVDDLVGWNFVTNTNNPFDDHGHGTHVGGTIAAMGNNALGLVGVNWTVLVMALKFLDSNGSGSSLAAAEAVRYAADLGARVSNNSYGGAGGTTLYNAISYAASKGNIFVAAAGNAGQDTDATANYPSAYPLDNIISVAAIAGDGSLAGFSNYGARTVDVGAPGVGILSTLPNNGYASWSGTSMAAPHVTGTVALVLAQHPEWTYSQIIGRLLATTTPIAALAGKTVTGGIINAAAALAPPVVPPPSSDVLYREDFDGSTLGLAWRAVGGNWVRRDGILRQSTMQWGDPQKAMVVGTTYPSDVEVSARVRVDSWAGGAGARAGVSLAQTGNGLGYNLLFRDGGVQFLNDYVAWSPLFPFDWQEGTWYHFKLRSADSVLYGKVWQDGTSEPSDWMFSQSGWDNRSGGYAGLNGGSGGSTASFDDFVVSKVDGTPSLPSSPTNLSTTAVAPGQINLNWSAAGGADGYTIERSPDGTTGWTRVGTTPSSTTAFQDTGLSASTAYYYRVLATNTAGSSDPSNVAVATTPAVVTPPVDPDALFRDDFGGSALGAAWRTVGGNWVQRDGVLSQSALQPGDPQKAMVADRVYPHNVEVSARVRVDSWAGGDWARAGVSLSQNAGGAGYNLLFRDGGVQFLNDYAAWSPLFPFDWNVGTWYHFKLRSADSVLYGKVWQDGTSEPSDWMFSQSGWDNRWDGFAGLNGGSGGSTASFDDIVVTSVEGQGAVRSSATDPAATSASAGQVGQGGSGASDAAAPKAGSGSRRWLRLSWASRLHDFRKGRRVSQGSGR